jgi:nucleoside-diphosphate-sugar epimerase
VNSDISNKISLLNKKILVVGGGEFIGSRLVNKFLFEEYKVTVLDKKQTCPLAIRIKFILDRGPVI